MTSAERLSDGGSNIAADDVHFDETDYFAPQLVAWAPDGTFYWGYHVLEALHAGYIQPEDVIELCKLLLYTDHVTSPLAQRVQAQLGGTHTLRELIATHLRAVIGEAKEHMKRANYLRMSAEVRRPLTPSKLRRSRC